MKISCVASFCSPLAAAVFALMVLVCAGAQALPAPAAADVAYGEDPMQQLDVYLPAGEGPFPVALFIHGGGWVNGDKVEKLNASHLQRFLDAGVAVVSINYRFIPQARQAGVYPPVLMPLGDARRALQFVRYHAADWDLNPERVVVFGGSAGAFSSLWLGLSDDMADPDSADPVERESTRVKGIGGLGAQTSLDPAQMRAWVGEGLTYGGHAFKQPNFQAFLDNREQLAEYFPLVSPAALVDAGDPPVFLTYGVPLNDPGTGKYDFTHSARWGVAFKQIADERGAVCMVAYRVNADDPVEGGDIIAFLIERAKAD
jgi:acetyl esterase/lipase